MNTPNGNWTVDNSNLVHNSNVHLIYQDDMERTYRVKYLQNPENGNAGHVSVDRALNKDNKGEWIFKEYHAINKGDSVDVTGKAIRVRLCHNNAVDGFAKGSYDIL
jgi:hypothetical protein